MPINFLVQIGWQLVSHWSVLMFHQCLTGSFASSNSESASLSRWCTLNVLHQAVLWFLQLISAAVCPGLCAPGFLECAASLGFAPCFVRPPGPFWVCRLTRPRYAVKWSRSFVDLWFPPFLLLHFWGATLFDCVICAPLLSIFGFCISKSQKPGANSIASGRLFLFAFEFLSSQIQLAFPEPSGCSHLHLLSIAGCC